MLHAIWWEVFHMLWGQNKELIYDKKKWLKLQKQLEEVEQDIQTMSAQQLQEKYLMQFDKSGTGDAKNGELSLEIRHNIRRDFQRQMKKTRLNSPIT